MALPLALDALLEAYVVACREVDRAEAADMDSDDPEEFADVLGAHFNAKRDLMTALDPIIWAATKYLHGEDDHTEHHLQALADALGVDHADVEALA